MDWEDEARRNEEDLNDVLADEIAAERGPLMEEYRLHYCGSCHHAEILPMSAGQLTCPKCNSALETYTKVENEQFFLLLYVGDGFTDWAFHGVWPSLESIKACPVLNHLDGYKIIKGRIVEQTTPRYEEDEELEDLPPQEP